MLSSCVTSGWGGNRVSWGGGYQSYSVALKKIALAQKCGDTEVSACFFIDLPPFVKCCASEKRHGDALQRIIINEVSLGTQHDQ